MVTGMERLDSVTLPLAGPDQCQPDRPSSSWSSAATPTRRSGRRRSRGPRPPARDLPDGLLGGIPAENHDIEETNARDTKLIVPLVLLVIALILIAVLRALVAPPYLIGHRPRLLRRHARPLPPWPSPWLQERRARL